MTVQNLPFALSGNYQCSFSGYGVTRNTSVVQIDRQDAGNSTLKCETPTANLLPPFPTGKGKLSKRCLVPLSFRLDRRHSV